MEITEAELKSKIAEATATALAGLTSKNTELIGDIKATKKLLKEFEGLDVELLQSQSAELAKLKESSMTDAERFAQQQEESAKKHTETQQALLDSQAKVLKMTKDNSVANALRDAGQLQEGMGEAVSLLISQKITMSDANIPMVGDKTVAEYVGVFAENDGKNFFVPKNAGGGGQGSGGGRVITEGYTLEDGSLNNTKIAQLRRGTVDQQAEAGRIVEAHKAAAKK